MKRIEGSPMNLKSLLQNTKYSLHYYQREYMCQRKHLEELIDDLTSESLIITKPETLIRRWLNMAHILWVQSFWRVKKMITQGFCL